MLLFASALSGCARGGPRVGVAAAGVGGAGRQSPFDVPTQHNDSQRTGATLTETRLTPQALKDGAFGHRFQWDVDGQMYAQPLYLSAVPYRGRTINMVIVATMKNNVYAFEAPASGSDDDPPAEALWRVGPTDLGDPLPYNYFSMQWGILGHNIVPYIGITSTPVIDRMAGKVYVAVKYGSGRLPFGLLKDPGYRLVAIDLLTGAVDRMVEIDATYRDADGAEVTLDADHHLQRPGLLLQDGRIYLGFGSHQDSPPYHGWVLAYDASSLALVGTYCTTCGHTSASCHPSGMGGIWQAGGGLAGDGKSVYVMTGNGTFDPTVGDRASSFIKLDRDLHVVGSWTPANPACLTRTDSDLGSAGPMILPTKAAPQGAEPVLVGGGKEGILYALMPSALTGSQLGGGHAPAAYPCYDRKDPAPDANGPGYWSIQAAHVWERSGLMDFLRLFDPAVLSQGYHHIHGSPAAWRVRSAGGERLVLYVAAERDPVRAYTFDGSGGFIGGAPPGTAPVDTYHSACTTSDHGMPGAFLALSANGDDPSSGIVWATMPRRNKDALHHVVPGILRAYQAIPDSGNVMLELWNSDIGTETGHGCADARPSGGSEVGLLAKYAPPTVAEGHVYVPTFSGHLDVYGFYPAGERPPPPQSLVRAAPLDRDASMSTQALPATASPGQPVLVVVQARNRGRSTWRAADGVSLLPRKMAGDFGLLASEAGALVIKRDVAFNETYTFQFHVTLPVEEGTYYASWQLAFPRGAGGTAPFKTFGDATPEWSFAIAKPECKDLRDRAAAVLARAPAEQLILPSDRSEVAAIRASAERRDCTILFDMQP
jgi:hypothetical protein